MIAAEEIVDGYLRWLREKIEVDMIKDVIEVTTPFLDSHNDYIQIYFKQEGSKIVITDDGFTISDLYMSGCDLSTERRQKTLSEILNGFGVKRHDEELYVEANANNYPQKKHALLQAIMTVSDMFMLAQSRVASVFFEDVALFLDESEIRYTPKVQFTGKSGFLHTYDFVIPASKWRPERFIRAINNPSKENAASLLFAWGDTKTIRQENAQMFVFLNDSEHSVRADLKEAFDQYDVQSINWSARETAIGVLAA
jgi:hypothetical protein